MKMQKQQSTAHNSKNDTWTIAEYNKNIYKSSKYCGHAEWYDFPPSDTT